ncbi:sortase [Helicobacter pylori]|uniref:sortase n=1 Tax=Helicobacter pylori TaxID=210 RepID=UPI00165B3018|nr:sortase [Helicobacter pylori]WQS43681.1 sortase [Helicobacter pylori]
MPLPFILGGLALAAVGYGLKKSLDASDTADEINIVIKKANDLKEEAIKKAELVESDCKNALIRLGEKKFHVQSYSMSSFVKEFNQLKGREFVVKVADMQVSNAQNLFSQLNTNGMTDESIIEKMLIGYGSLGVSSFTAGAIMGGGLAASGLAGMAVFGGLIAGPALAILGAVRADDMEEKLENAKAYYSQVEAAVKKADVMIDDLRSVEKMADLFTRQITKFDVLFFSLAQDAIATMKKRNYDYDSYNREDEDQLSVTVSTLMTLNAFLEVSIMDKYQKLTEKAKNALILMRDQMDSLKNGNYSLDGIGFRQARLKDLRDDKNS